MANKSILEKSWKTAFAKEVSTLIGYQISKDDIFSDKPEFQNNPKVSDYVSDFISKKTGLLHPSYPLILMPSFTIKLVVLIPNSDYQKLEKGEIEVIDYIQTSHFYYGYLLGGDDIVSTYWQSFETGTGIHECDKISRYFNNLASKFHDDVSLKDLINEHDPRLKLLKKIEEYTLHTLGYKADFISSYETDTNDIQIRKYCSSVTALIPQHILSDILYYPERNWSHKIDAIKFKITINE